MKERTENIRKQARKEKNNFKIYRIVTAAYCKIFALKTVHIFEFLYHNI
jgi:hypothetical protein